jgi:hypothetical protein
MTPEEQALLGAAALRTAATDDIELYYVDVLNDGAGGGSEGEAFPASAVPDAKYADSIIVGANSRVQFLVAHEIGHVLLNTGVHFPPEFAQINLMRRIPTRTDTPTSPKRLTPNQESEMLSKRPNLLTGP